MGVTEPNRLSKPVLDIRPVGGRVYTRISLRRRISISEFSYSVCIAAVAMPEGEPESVRIDATEASSSAAEEPPTMARGAQRVTWPVEDPSEFRPELAPGGDLIDVGKEAEDFRAFYEVSDLRM